MERRSHKMLIVVVAALAVLLVVGPLSGPSGVLLAQGTACFTQAAGSPIPVGDGPFSVGVGDFTGDGRLDLAVANSQSDTVTILLGNGTGGFTPAVGSPISVGDFPSSVGVGDFTGDGRLDLAVANLNADTVTILLGNGSGGFSPAPNSPNPVGDGPIFVAVGDFTGDGRLDLAVANVRGADVYTLLGDGSGGFSPPPC